MRDAVLLNAGAALAVHESGDGSLEERLLAGLDRARASVDSGAAEAVLRAVGRGQRHGLMRRSAFPRPAVSPAGSSHSPGQGVVSDGGQ